MKRYVSEKGRRLWIGFVIFGLFLCFTKETKARQTSAGVQNIKRIALTFDDGPHPIYTPKLLEGLKERGILCTFFVTGENASLYPELIAQMKEDGHLVGNHTYHHVQLSAVGEDLFLQELSETNRVLEDILGTEIVFVRPPYGDWNKAIETQINMLPVLWDIDPLDWCSNNAQKVVHQVVEQAEDETIVLLHDYYETSIEAAFEIIDELTKEGYTFVTVEDILME